MPLLVQPFVLPSVREAESRLIARNLDHEYTTIVGVPDFVRLSTEFVYGPSSAALKEKRVAAAQALSGTGALRIAAAFLARFREGDKTLYIPDQTWGNHIQLSKDAGLTVARYKYYDPRSCGLDFAGFTSDVHKAPDGSVFLFHACAHNPTGVDPTRDQWKELLSIVQKKKHVVLFDSAYQGFASGDADADAFAIRLFEQAGVDMLVCQSFAKNFGLYGERVGTFSIVCKVRFTVITRITLIILI